MAKASLPALAPIAGISIWRMPPGGDKGCAAVGGISATRPLWPFSHHLRTLFELRLLFSKLKILPQFRNPCRVITMDQNSTQPVIHLSIDPPDLHGFSHVSGLYGPGAWSAWYLCIVGSWLGLSRKISGSKKTGALGKLDLNLVTYTYTNSA
jgi:hypothetical protein